MEEYVPDPKAYAFAWWRNPDNGKMFIAQVYKVTNGWMLKTGRGPKRLVDSGLFQNSKALIKFVRKKASEVCPDQDPMRSTLGKIKNRDPLSVIPECYEPAGEAVDGPGGRGLLACVSCPYRLKCGEPPIHQGESKPVQEEPEAVFIARLKKKLKAKYGAGYGR